MRLLPVSLALSLAGAAVAGDPVLRLRVRDEATGKPIRNLECGLVDPSRGEVYARFEGSVYNGRRRPRGGDRLWIYCRGHDIVRLDLGKDQRVVDARLPRWTGSCTMVVKGADRPVPLTLSVTVRTGPRGRAGPVRDHWERAVKGNRITIPFPRGGRVIVMGVAKRGLLWPLAHRARHGAELTCFFEPPRRVAVRRDPDAPPIRRAEVEFFPDRLWKPRADPREIDAWRWLLNGPGWLRKSLLTGTGALEVAPDIPFHCFARIEGVPVYRHVSRREAILDLRRPHRSKRVFARPRIDGRPVRAGTILAPGRLDLYTVASVWQLREWLGGCAFQVGNDQGGWPRVVLPASGWLTAWHRDVGLVHLRWNKDEPPRGGRYAGALRVALPAGWTATGYVSVFPVWSGAGEVRTTPPDVLLRRAFEGTGEVRLDGLRPGRYGMDVRLDAVRHADGRRVGVARMAEIEIRAGDPTPAVHRVAVE